jgi:hypothetical protein
MTTIDTNADTMVTTSSEKVRITFAIKTWFRESTKEWIGEIEYEYPTIESGSVRVTSDTEAKAFSKVLRKLKQFKTSGLAAN